MIVALVAAAVLVLLNVIYRRWTRHHRILSYIPGPKPKLLVGNVGDVSTTADLLPVVERYHREHGPVVKFFILNQANILIADYDFVEFILNSDIYNKSAAYDFLKNWIGTGLLTAPEAKWRKHRKILNPTFHVQLLEQFVDTFDSQSRVLAQILAKEVNNDGFDFTEYISFCTLDVICESAMGTSIEAQKHPTSEYVKSVHEMCRIVLERTFSAVQNFAPLYRLTANYSKEMKAVDTLHSQTNRVIRTKKEKISRATTENGNLIDEFGIRKKRQVFLDMLLSATDEQGQPLLTDEELQQEVDTFLFAGHDTTASAINFAMHCLATHPDVQKQVYKEQKIIFENAEDKLTYNTLQEMKYLEQVIKEVLRLYPPVPLYARLLMEDRVYDGKPLPSGTVLMINAYRIHRDEKFYENPEKFDPDRFSREKVRKPYSFIPFSAGARNCIGQKFAMLEMKSILSTLVRKFEILSTNPIHKLDVINEITLKSKNGIWIRLKHRDN